MRSIIRGVVALFAAFLMMDVAKAAPTIVSPVDYSTVQTLTDSMKNLISPLNSNVSIFSSANTTARENYETEYFYKNSVPATLSWSGTTGDCTVKVWRTNGGSESAPFFSETVSGTSTECYNLEVGCNYTWKVTDSQGNSAVGHFFTEDQAPRIIRGRRSNFTYSSGADCSNGRDIGGWATADGKRVKQGKIYRSGQLEYCSFKEGSGIYQKMDMLYDVLGIRVDVDLRTVNNVNAFADWTAEWDTGSDNVCKWSGIGPDVERFTIEWETLGKGPSTGNPYVYDGKYGCQFPSYGGFYGSMTIKYKENNVEKSYTQSENQNKIAVWAAFNRIYQAVVVDKEPVIFHCSHGKDRTGSLALVIHGLLGVSEANIKRDFATAWFCNPDYTFTQTSMNNLITNIKKFDTASTKTLAGGSEEYLISCATIAGDDAGATKVAAFKAAMIEEPETAAVDPNKISAPVAVTGLVYDGSELTGVAVGTGYTLTGNTAVDAGTHTAVATLVEGYKWADGSTDNKEISWSIAKATNEWTTEPKIEPATWTEGEAAGTLTSGVAKFGTVTSSMTELPTSAGNYTITYTVAEDKNYTGLTKEVSFTINAAAVDPDQPGGGDDTDDPVVIVPTINPDWGYVKTGLGTGGDEVAVVFTNHLDKAMTWTIPQNLKNVQFLVVGGGGGGGAGTQGPGGGGGGVVTGKVYSLSKGSVVLANVGVGGNPGVNNATGGSKGESSSFSVDNVTYITAYAGGAGRSNRNGGSGGGGTPGGTGGSATQGIVNEDVINLVYDIEKFGYAGGDGFKTSTSNVSGGGGGGALGVGGTPTNKTYGGTGGPGLPCDITGTLLTYGSGGGGSGSSGSSGGDGAGSGGNPASSGKANQGGGGGGGYGYGGDGGNGGSGIVVFRYGSANISVDPSEPEEPVLTAVDEPEAVADLVYTGSLLTGVVAADGYTLTGNTATDAGTYEATATLAEGYKWSDDTTEPKTINWSIAKATNEWTTEPSISLETWTQGETAGVLTAGVAKFGEVTSSMTELPTAVGKYTITYTVVETDNYSGLTKEVSFEITKKPTSYDFTVGDVALTDGKLTFKGNFAINGESEATEMNLVVSVYDVAEGGDALKTVTVEGIPAGEFNQEIDIAALELADGVYYLAFEVQDEAGNVLDKVEERSMLTIGEVKAVKPTVNYASGTKFTAIGVEQKPVVMPADGNGYTVSYEGDFTSAGTHIIVIALKDGWTWSDGTSDSLTYEYEFIERTYTEYYIKPRGGASEGGTFQSNDRWYTDPEFAAGSKMSTCPNVYDAHNIANIPADSQTWLLIDNEKDIVLKPKSGKFTVDGNLRIVTYSGGLMFQNDTATPMPIWEVKSGVSTIDGVVIDVNGSGTGYIDIAADTTNVLGGVNYHSGFESSKKLFVRFSDEATAGSALRVHNFEDYYITNFGWFEGGAKGSTYALDIDEGVLSLNNPDAVSGVAGNLAITVKLGDKVGAANAYLNVAGTLNINDGSTLAVDANAMPCGVYTIINAATFNGADLLTSAAGATVTGLAEFTSGELVREGNKIVLYIETTIPPRVPGIEGDSVATNAVFETARVAKPIWYKTKPAINSDGDEITFNRVTVKVPEYYDVTLETLADGYLVNLKLKDNLKAFIANKVENDQIVTPAIRIENEKVYIHLENTKSDLYYTLLKSTKLGAEAEWKQTEEYAIGKADFEYTPAEGEAETCFFKAGDVMDEPPAK